MRAFLIVTLFFVFSFTGFSQHQLGAKLSGGVSRITNDETNVQNGEYKILLGPSANIGLFYNYKINDKFLVGADLFLSQIEGRDRIDQTATNNAGEPIGTTYTNIEKHISYLSMPVYVGLNVQSVTIKLGGQASYLLQSSGSEDGGALINGIETRWNNQYDKLYIDDFDFGATAGVLFDFSEKLAIEGNIYYGLNNIIENNSWKWTVQQATLGVRYTFLSKTKEK